MTLTEVIIGLVLSGILVLTVGVALNAGAKFSQDATVRTQMRRDARVTLMHIEKRVRPMKGSQVAVNGPGDRLTISPAGVTASYWEKSGSNLNFFDGPGNQTIALVSGTVSTVQFAINPGERTGTYLVAVNLQLAQGAIQAPMSAIIELRNK